MEIDIRNTPSTKAVDTIRFSNADNTFNVSAIYTQLDGYIELSDNADTVIVAASDIPNLIKALEKAVELGWHTQGE